MTARIRDYLRRTPDEGPRLVVDLDVVRDNYNTFAKALPDTRVFYAVKANPAPEVLSLLASLGSCFDTASVPEIEMALAAGASADRVSFGNTIKKERDIARAYALGVRLYAGLAATHRSRLLGNDSLKLSDVIPSCPLGGQRRDMRFDEFAHLEHVGERLLLIDQHPCQRRD